MEIGWKFSTWGTPEHPCAACRRLVTSGHIRVDHHDPRAEHFATLCTSCWFKIRDVGIDPDPSAYVPDWANGGDPDQ